MATTKPGIRRHWHSPTAVRSTAREKVGLRGPEVAFLYIPPTLSLLKKIRELNAYTQTRARRLPRTLVIDRVWINASAFQVEHEVAKVAEVGGNP